MGWAARRSRAAEERCRDYDEPAAALAAAYRRDPSLLRHRHLADHIERWQRCRGHRRGRLNTRSRVLAFRWL